MNILLLALLACVVVGWARCKYLYNHKLSCKDGQISVLEATIHMRDRLIADQTERINNAREYLES